MTELQPCGTYGAYQRHLRLNEEPCDPCRKASNAYQRDLRRRNPAVLANSRFLVATRNRAMQQLADKHQREFLEILSEIRQEETR